MSFINDRFRRLVDAHHRKSSTGKRQMISLGAIGMAGGQNAAGGGEGGTAAAAAGGGPDGDSTSSTYAEASIRSDPNVYAGYTSETKLPFSAFQSLRKQPTTPTSSSTTTATAEAEEEESKPTSSSSGAPVVASSSNNILAPATTMAHSPEVQLTEQQEVNVRKALKKVSDGQLAIDDPHPFVSAFIEKHCTALSEYLPNNVTRAGATFLMLAVMCGHKDLTKECLRLRAQPNSASYLSWPAPPASEMEGEAPMTRHGFTPFFLAVICQHLEVAELLLENGAHISTTDRWGRTPLHAAYTLGDDEMVAWLLKHRALQSSFDRDRLRPGEDVHDIYPPPLNRRRVMVYMPTPEEAAKEAAERKGVDPTSKNRGGGGPRAAGTATAPATEDRLICTATRAEASMCHCQDCLEERLRLERAISNWMSPQYLEVLAAAADLERDQREQKASQVQAVAHAQLHQQQLADALSTVVREQQVQDQQRLQATNAAAAAVANNNNNNTASTKAGAAGSGGGGEQTPSPTAVVGEA